MLKSSFYLIIGCLTICIGINTFFVSYHLLDGGVIGLGLIAHYLWNTPIGLTFIIVSIPIYIYAWKHYRSFFYNSIAGLVFSALFIDWFYFLNFSLFDFGPLPSALIGGALLGIGVGLMFRVDISTGGLDLLAQMIAAKFRWNVGVLIFILDLLVVFAGLYTITKQEIILSLIAVSATGVATIIMTLSSESHIHS
ncbi:YitT family protein [Bacillus solitudinis]|uniref:YitT family protein n=1 Tax=Bacillus solitudinis TaxID=2014074 RepID=UPI000C236652|nr:YitT family protein [Bacillus solitudinis]